MTKKSKRPEAEIANDPSLKWTPYSKWEALWSDTHGVALRFLGYTDCGKIRLGSLNAIEEVATVNPLSVRRPTIMTTPPVLGSSEKRFLNHVIVENHKLAFGITE